MTTSNQPPPRSILPLPLAGEGRGEGGRPNHPKPATQRRQTTLIHPTHD